MPTITVIVLTFNQRQMTLECLATLAAQVGPPFAVLLWDNGSTDGTLAAVSSAFPAVHVHRSDTNLGVAGGRNAAAKLAIATFSPSHLLFLDNDMLLEPDFVSGLFEPFRDNATVGQTQAKLRFMHDRARLNDGGGARINYLLWRVTPVGFGEIDLGQYDTVLLVVGCPYSHTVEKEHPAYDVVGDAAFAVIVGPTVAGEEYLGSVIRNSGPTCPLVSWSVDLKVPSGIRLAVGAKTAGQLENWALQQLPELSRERGLARTGVADNCDAHRIPPETRTKRKARRNEYASQESR